MTDLDIFIGLLLWLYNYMENRAESYLSMHFLKLQVLLVRKRSIWENLFQRTNTEYPNVAKFIWMYANCLGILSVYIPPIFQIVLLAIFELFEHFKKNVCNYSQKYSLGDIWQHSKVYAEFFLSTVDLLYRTERIILQA